MGSLTSRPNIPAQPQTVIYTPSPPTSPYVPPVTPPTPPSAAEPSAETSAEVRRQNLLERDRSRLGTIATSFRGLLGLSDKTTPRKTLLGE